MGRVGEIAVFTRDLTATRAFYAQLTGAAPIVDLESIAIFDAGGVRLLVHAAWTPVHGGPPNEDHLGIVVDDLDAAWRRFAGDGAQLVLPPTDLPWGRSAYLRDPDGRLIELSAR